jgi:hypothetical protein
MKTAYESTLVRLRALVLIVMWFITALTGAISGDVHAAPTGKVITWGDNTFGQLNVPAGLSGIRAIAVGAFHTMTLRRLPLQVGRSSRAREDDQRALSRHQSAADMAFG